MGQSESKPKLNVDVINVIHNTKNTIQMLQKKVSHNEKKLQLEVNNAKLCISNKNKSKALIHLRRKKLLEKQINNLYGQIMNLEQQCISLEGLKMNQQVVNTMKTTSNTMKELNKSMDVDKVDNIMSDIQDNIDDIEEVNQMLSNPIGDATTFDDDELLAELDEMESETQINSEQIEKPIILPEVPKNKLPMEDEEEVFNKLEKMMA